MHAMALRFDSAPPFSTVHVYVPADAVLWLGGATLVVGAINATITSDGGTLDAEYRSSIFDVRPGGRFRVEKLELVHGGSTDSVINGGVLTMLSAAVEMVECYMHRPQAINGGAALVSYGRLQMTNCTVRRSDETDTRTSVARLPYPATALPP